jgi:hypothetical protein
VSATPEPLIVIVCGSRDWSDRLAVFGDLDWLLKRSEALEIAHGACSKGADQIAAEWCVLRGVVQRRYPANWLRGRSAGMQRSRIMATQSGARHCLAYWDGRSPGTLHMIQLATQAGIHVTVTAPVLPVWGSHGGGDLRTRQGSTVRRWGPGA